MAKDLDVSMHVAGQHAVAAFEAIAVYARERRRPRTADSGEGGRDPAPRIEARITEIERDQRQLPNSAATTGTPQSNRTATWTSTGTPPRSCARSARPSR